MLKHVILELFNVRTIYMFVFLPLPQAILLSFPYFQKDFFCFLEKEFMYDRNSHKYPVCTNVETWDMESKK